MEIESMKRAAVLVENLLATYFVPERWQSGMCWRWGRPVD